MRRIVIENIKKTPVEKSSVQIAERKGIGHPDTLMDGICNSASNALSTYYLQNFRSVLHHNVDKGLLIAGQSKPRFGGGKIIKPMEIIIAGRATAKVGSKKMPVDSVIKREAVNYLKNFQQLGRNYRLDIRVKEGALNLKEAFRAGIPIANDTSFGVAHAPLSMIEKMTLDVCNFLNLELPKKMKSIGADVKVMCAAYDRKIKLSLAVAFIDKYISSMSDYIEQKDRLRESVAKFIKTPCEIELNTLDNVKGDESSIYLTVTGLSAEHGDDGQTGRGNRPTGLITPNRPMSMEATAGKNINHPGKLYQVLSQIIADKIAKLDGVKECYVKLLTQIGKPLDCPLVSVELLDNKRNVEKSAKIANRVLDSLQNIQRDIVKNKYRLF
jgi:S-adenosylmethionine synthetase